MTSSVPSGKLLDADFMFTKLFVHDLEKSAEFYVSVLGLVEMARVDAEIMGRAVKEIVYMPTYSGGPMFILGSFSDSQKPASEELILGFSTKDMDALLARVEKAGGQLVQKLEISPTVPFLTAFIKDVEGHVVQISQSVG